LVQLKPHSITRLQEISGLVCPGCNQNSLKKRHRLLVAVRAQARCPACGIAIRFGFWPRVVHSLFGDALLLAGFIGALLWQAPFVLLLASTSWLSLALLLPVDSDRKDPITRRKVARSPKPAA
jgi:Zn ribbon nucleic-acid-binding protein